MEDVVPNNIYDRQVRAFQFKIQQSLNLHDDEIERLSTHLEKVQARILQAKEKIENLDREITEAVESKTGRMKRGRATAYANIARIKVSYNHHIQELQNQQREEIEGLQHDFEAEMERLTTFL